VAVVIAGFLAHAPVVQLPWLFLIAAPVALFVAVILVIYSSSELIVVAVPGVEDTLIGPSYIVT
jgi:hypothetical protein